MDTLMDSNEVVGEAWGDSDDLPLNLDTEVDGNDSRKKKSLNKREVKERKKKGYLLPTIREQTERRKILLFQVWMTTCFLI